MSGGRVYRREAQEYEYLICLGLAATNIIGWPFRKTDHGKLPIAMTHSILYTILNPAPDLQPTDERVRMAGGQQPAAGAELL